MLRHINFVEKNVFQKKTSLNTFLSDPTRAEKYVNTLFFNKNIFYKNIEAEICEILRIF